MRYWLARLILGKHGYIYRVTFTGNRIDPSERDVRIENCTFQ
jgi:hypothetical protein